MQKKLWTFISYLFHPALMPTLGTFIVLWNDPNLFIPLDTEKPWIIVLGVVFVSTYILPLLLSWAVFKFGKISSLSNPTENDRRFLLILTSLCYLLIFYCFRAIPDSGQSLKIFMFGINISVIVTLLVSLFTKVSFHSVGVGGLLGTVIGLTRYAQADLFPWLLAAFAVVIITAFARYKLKAHEAFDIFVGLIIGIAVQSLVFFFRIHGV